MRKLFINTTILVLLQLSAICQTDTSIVRIPLPIGKEIVRDLGRLDEARVKIVLLEENVRNYKLMVESYEKTNKQYEEMMRNAAMIADLRKADLADMTKKYKGQVRKNRFLFVVAVAAGAFGVYQTIK